MLSTILINHFNDESSVVSSNDDCLCCVAEGLKELVPRGLLFVRDYRINHKMKSIRLFYTRGDQFFSRKISSTYVKEIYSKLRQEQTTRSLLPELNLVVHLFKASFEPFVSCQKMQQGK